MSYSARKCPRFCGKCTSLSSTSRQKDLYPVVRLFLVPLLIDDCVYLSNTTSIRWYARPIPINELHNLSAKSPNAIAPSGLTMDITRAWPSIIRFACECRMIYSGHLIRLLSRLPVLTCFLYHPFLQAILIRASVYDLK